MPLLLTWLNELPANALENIRFSATLVTDVGCLEVTLFSQEVVRVCFHVD